MSLSESRLDNHPVSRRRSTNAGLFVCCWSQWEPAGSSRRYLLANCTDTTHEARYRSVVIRQDKPPMGRQCYMPKPPPSSCEPDEVPKSGPRASKRSKKPAAEVHLAPLPLTISPRPVGYLRASSWFPPISLAEAVQDSHFLEDGMEREDQS